MTSIVHPDGDKLSVAGDKTKVLYIDLISSVSLKKNRSGILKSFKPEYFPFIDISMYFQFCIDKEAQDTLDELKSKFG